MNGEEGTLLDLRLGVAVNIDFDKDIISAII
jgi:hypothetical protein